MFIQVNEIRNRSGILSTPITKLYGISFISLIKDNGNSANIIIDGKNVNEERIVSETFSAINNLLNNNHPEFLVQLNTTDGELIILKASNIVEVYDNENSKGVVRYRDNERKEDVFYTVDETISDIIDLQPNRYKEYIALLSQSGTNDPTVTVIKNELSGDIVWTRVNAGVYDGTLVGEFLDDTTGVLCMPIAPAVVGGGRVSDDAIRLRVTDPSSGSGVDAKIDDSMVRIVVKI